MKSRSRTGGDVPPILVRFLGLIGPVRPIAPTRSIGPKSLRTNPGGVGKKRRFLRPGSNPGNTWRRKALGYCSVKPYYKIVCGLNSTAVHRESFTLAPSDLNQAVFRGPCAAICLVGAGTSKHKPLIWLLYVGRLSLGASAPQEKCRAPFSGEDFVDVTRTGGLRPGPTNLGTCGRHGDRTRVPGACNPTPAKAIGARRTTNSPQAQNCPVL